MSSLLSPGLCRVERHMLITDWFPLLVISTILLVLFYKFILSFLTLVLHTGYWPMKRDGMRVKGLTSFHIEV